MKQILSFTLAVCLVLGLCACGNGADPVETPQASAPVETAGVPATGTPEPTPENSPAPATPEPSAPPEETPEPVESEPPEEPVHTETPVVQTPAPVETAAPVTDPKTVAAGYIGQNVSGLYAAIGYPQYSDYAPSCLGEGGEDGNLYYDGFIVYTYRENGVETVNYVE